MPQAIITIQAKQGPAIGKKQGKVQDTTGALWNVWGDKLANFREGVTYEITYEEGEFNGRQFNLIKTSNPTNVAPPAKPPSAQPQPRNDGWPGPVPQQGNQKDEMIFVCGIVNNAMSNPNVQPFQVTLAEFIAFVNNARAAWRNTLGKSQRDQELNDEIPS